MNANLNSVQPVTTNPNQPTAPDQYDFDLWAREVRRQMIASIKKREYKD